MNSKMNIMNDIHILSLNKKIPEFIVKVYNMLEKRQYSKIVCWSDDGTEIQIKNCAKLEDSVLPHYFRHGKAESFIRQLNMYGFNKKNRPSHRNSIFFKNQYFLKGDPQSMTHIKRKRKQQLDKKQSELEVAEETNPKINYEKLTNQIEKLKKKHPDLVEEMKKISELANRIVGSSDSTVPENDLPQQKEYIPPSIIFQTLKDVSKFHNSDSMCSFGQRAQELQ